jgi:hypothetical protein
VDLIQNEFSILHLSAKNSEEARNASLGFEALDGERAREKPGSTESTIIIYRLTHSS